MEGEGGAGLAEDGASPSLAGKGTEGLGSPPLLIRAEHYYEPPTVTYANAVHAAQVEADVATGAVRLLRYVVVHDCGRVINPVLVDGQIHGGVAQGIGNAFYERLAYDENGQLLNGTFMDYHLPTSLDVPRIETGHGETLSPLNPMGVKGAGEAGAIPVGPLFAQALEDALWDVDFEILEIPLNSNRLWELTGKIGG